MTHPARTLRDRMPVAFTAHSVETSYMKRHICKFVLERDVVPINPFMGFEYFLSDTVDRDLVRRGNNTYAHVCDELWTFGTISDGSAGGKSAWPANWASPCATSAWARTWHPSGRSGGPNFSTRTAWSGSRPFDRGCLFRSCQSFRNHYHQLPAREFSNTSARSHAMNTTIDVTFPEGTRVDARVGQHLIHTDQSADSGGSGNAPEPGALFLASIASCSGWYALKFCQARDIPADDLGLSMEVAMDEKKKMIHRIHLRLALPGGFPDKYRDAVVRAMNQCFVKKHLSENIAFDITLE